MPKGARGVILPKNDKIKIFAMTVAVNKNDDCTPLQPLYDDFQNDKPFELRTASQGN